MISLSVLEVSESASASGVSAWTLTSTVSPPMDGLIIDEQFISNVEDEDDKVDCEENNSKSWWCRRDCRDLSFFFFKQSWWFRLANSRASSRSISIYKIRIYKIR